MKKFLASSYRVKFLIFNNFSSNVTFLERTITKKGFQKNFFFLEVFSPFYFLKIKNIIWKKK